MRCNFDKFVNIISKFYFLYSLLIKNINKIILKLNNYNNFIINLIFVIIIICEIIFFYNYFFLFIDFQLMHNIIFISLIFNILKILEIFNKFLDIK